MKLRARLLLASTLHRHRLSPRLPERQCAIASLSAQRRWRVSERPERQQARSSTADQARRPAHQPRQRSARVIRLARCTRSGRSISTKARSSRSPSKNPAATETYNPLSNLAPAIPFSLVLQLLSTRSISHQPTSNTLPATAPERARPMLPVANAPGASRRRSDTRCRAGRGCSRLR